MLPEMRTENEHNELDELFHRQLAAHEVAPPDQVWAGIERRIAKKKKRRGGFWLFFGLLLLLSGGTAYYFMSRNTTASPLAEKAPLTQSRIAPAQQASVAAADSAARAAQQDTAAPASANTTPAAPVRSSAPVPHADNTPNTAGNKHPHEPFTPPGPAERSSGLAAGTPQPDHAGNTGPGQSTAQQQPAADPKKPAVPADVHAATAQTGDASKPPATNPAPGNTNDPAQQHSAGNDVAKTNDPPPNTATNPPLVQNDPSKDTLTEMSSSMRVRKTGPAKTSDSSAAATIDSATQLSPPVLNAAQADSLQQLVAAADTTHKKPPLLLPPPQLPPTNPADSARMRFMLSMLAGPYKTFSRPATGDSPLSNYPADFFSNAEKQELRYEPGVNATVLFGKNFGISTGAGWMSMGTVSSPDQQVIFHRWIPAPVYFYTSTGTLEMNSMDFDKPQDNSGPMLGDSIYLRYTLTTKFSYLRVPLSAQYSFGGKKLRGTISAGAAMLLRQSLYAGLQLHNSASDRFFDVSDPSWFHGPARVSEQAIFAVGADFRPGKHLHFLLNIPGGMYLSSFAKGGPVSSKPLTIGINGGLGWEF